MGFFDQINTAENSNEAATKEKHLPEITIEDLGDGQKKVTVNVGGGKHPNEIDHWIQWAVLRVNDMYIGKAEFSAKVMEPIATFVVNCQNIENCSLSVRARCNKHGIWETKATCC